MRRSPHALRGPAQRAAADGLAEAGEDRERFRVDHGVFLIVGGAQPDFTAAHVDIAPLEVRADFDAAGDFDAGGIDPRDGAVALFLHPDRAVARNEEAGRGTERDCAGDGIGGGVDTL